MDASPRERRQRWLFAGLYLCEGAPIGFLWWALPTILRERGADLERIGTLTAWLVLPWALKFLWAPLIDAGRGTALRTWIACSQGVMAATLLPLLWLDPARSLGWVTAALVLHAVAAASQDAAIDSLAIRTVPGPERGRLNGWMQVGMLVGRSAFGGGALLAREHLGDAPVVALLAGGLALGAVLLWRFGPRPPAPRDSPGVGLRAHLAAALSGGATWWGLLFAATSGAGFEAVGVLAGPMLVDRGVPSRTIGVFFGLGAVLAMATGALLGGRASDRFGTRRALLSAGLALGASVLVLAALVDASATPDVLLVPLGAVYLGIGAFTASSYALFMALTDPSLGATQFSAFMGATNLCESWSARVGSRIAARSGYGGAFTWPALIGLTSLVLLLRLGHSRSEETSVSDG